MYRYLGVSAAGAVALASAFLLVDLPTNGAQPAGSIAQGSVQSIGCTVKLLDVEKRRLEVIVGVGHALRIVRMDLSGGCVASARGTHVPLEQIHHGDIVRVRSESPQGAPVAPTRRVATRIDLVLNAAGRGRR